MQLRRSMTNISVNVQILQYSTMDGAFNPAKLVRTLTQFGFLRQVPFLFFNSFASKSNAEHHRRDASFMRSYLVHSCGLSPEIALKLSEKVRLTNPDRANAVLALLKNYGFSQTQLSKFVKQQPSVLLADPEKTLLPKLQFFNSVGVSITDLPKLLIGNTVLLSASLGKNLIPRYKVLRSVLRNEVEVVSALKSGPWSFTYCYITHNLVPNIEVLRQFGVPQASISLLVCNFPRIAYMKHSRFVDAAKKTKEMGFDPLKTPFVLALQVLAKMNKVMWESRLEVYNRWGWSKNTSLLAFKRYPQCMMFSESKIMKAMSFLVKNMGWPPEEIARTPGILNRNLEKTIIPRCTVVKILKSKGLIKNDSRLSTFIFINENNFLKRYVSQFQKNVPLLLEVYLGQIDDLEKL